MTTLVLAQGADGPGGQNEVARALDAVAKLSQASTSKQVTHASVVNDLQARISDLVRRPGGRRCCPALLGVLTKSGPDGTTARRGTCAPA